MCFNAIYNIFNPKRRGQMVMHYLTYMIIVIILHTYSTSTYSIILLVTRYFVTAKSNTVL